MAHATRSNLSIVLDSPGRLFFCLFAETKSLQLHTPESERICRPPAWPCVSRRSGAAEALGWSFPSVFVLFSLLEVVLKELGFLPLGKSQFTWKFWNLPKYIRQGSPAIPLQATQREQRVVVWAPSRALQLSRGFLCLRTMLLRHPHAAPRNALQRKMAGGGAELEWASQAEGPAVLLQSREGVCSARAVGLVIGGKAAQEASWAAPPASSLLPPLQ